MKRFNNAFTLTELMIALGVIAILCAILLPVIFNMMPNQNTLMAKRAYYATQTVISELINDESCYPDKTSAVNNPRIGFDDGFGGANCAKWDTSKGNNATTKFITLFRDKLGVEGTGTTFTTSDGMTWVFTDANFAYVKNGDGGSIKLSVDVNGTDTGKGKPNCSNGHAYTAEFGNGVDADCAANKRSSGFDRFRMTIKGNGQITIDAGDTWAREAVRIDKSLTDE